MNTPYSPPPANDPNQPAPSHNEGSVARALAGDYDFDIWEVIQTAWESTDGYKMPVAIIGAVYFVIYLVAMGLTAGLFGSETTGIIAQQLVGLLFAPMNAAFFMIGLRMANREEINTAMLFAHYDKLLPLVGLQLVVSVAVLIGLLLLVLPGIYLAYAVLFASPLMVEKGMGIVEAFETSRKAVTHHWFKFFGLWLVMGLIMFISMLPLGIGLFWTTPMMLLLLGQLYLRLFGLGTASSNHTSLVG